VVIDKTVYASFKPEVSLNAEIIPDLDIELLKKLVPPYKVILHNDDYNSMDHVVKALRKSVPGISKEAAHKIMMTAHEEGSAVVTTCPLETAELYQARLTSFGLTCTIEKDD
jgi:ATP-dependent Clp protease adaptor protein ClpS